MAAMTSLENEADTKRGKQHPVHGRNYTIKLSMAGFNVFGPVYIDGVPVKINDKFRPPPKISLPPKFEIGNPTEVLFLDYDFSLEERVVAWTDERERRQREEQEQAQQAAEAAEAEAKKLLEESKNSTNSDEVVEEQSPQSEESVAHSDTINAVQNQKEQNTVDIKDNMVHYSNDRKRPQAGVETQGVSAMPFVSVNQPVYAGASAGILQPLPAAKNYEHINTHRRLSSFDPTDFENELDPFDRLELKTLDDMKELDQVLQNVHVSTEAKEDKVGNNSPEQSSGGSALQDKNPQVVNGHSNHAALQEVNLSHNISANSVSYPNTCANMAVTSAIVGLNAQSNLVSYKPMPMEYLTNTTTQMSHQEQPAAFPSKNSVSQQPHASSFPSSVSYNNVNSAMYGSVSNTQPAVPNTHTSVSASNSQFSSSINVVSNENPTQNHQTVGANVSHMQNIPVQNNMNQFEIWREFLQKNSSSGSTSISQNANLSGHNVLSTTVKTAPNGYVGLGTSQGNDVPSASGSKSQANSRSHTPTLPEKPRLRSARSTPDLASLENSPQKEPLSRTVINTTTPPSVLTTRNASQPGSCDKVVSKNAMHHKASSSSPLIIDPYRQLTRDDQRFVDSVTNMGFKRVNVSRAVQRIGRDEKQVLDFLCGLTRLKDKGFSETEAEEVLILLQNDHKKAQHFLALSKRFQEFGFDNCKVKEGLLHCDLDEEKTLDWLTAQ